jgi:hypothetical protein
VCSLGETGSALLVALQPLVHMSRLLPPLNALRFADSVSDALPAAGVIEGWSVLETVRRGLGGLVDVLRHLVR